MSYEIGQRVEIDVFGLRVPGLTASDAQATGTVVALGPGIITVRLETSGSRPSEVTISPGRVRW
jgi:hypothetical protein